MANLVLKNITKSFGEVIAVDNVNLEIKDKEFLVLVGPSGCGKSTTLRMIAGLEEISDGELYINDKLVNDVAPKDRDIAMVFQNYALYPHMNVYDNMAFGLKLRKIPKTEINRRVTEAAELLGIDNLLKRKPKELSGGQRQRVALGRAIVREPQAFLMDEPLSNLDAKLRVQMRAELSKLHNRLQTTTIYVTHDQTEAMTLGSRIAIMDHGVLQQLDTPEQIYNNPANVFVAGFIGSPQMNFITCNIEHQGEDILLKTNTFTIKLPEQYQPLLKQYNQDKVVLGIRPEDIYVRDEYLEKYPETVIPAKVEVVEPLGSEIHLYLTTGEESITARIAPGLSFHPGDNLKIAIDTAKIHLFDATTEKRLIQK